MAIVAAGFLFINISFGKSPPLSIKPEVHRVGELATKKPPEGGYLVQWSQRPGSNR